MIIKELFEGPVGDYCIARNTYYQMLVIVRRKTNTIICHLLYDFRTFTLDTIKAMSTIWLKNAKNCTTNLWKQPAYIAVLQRMYFVSKLCAHCLCLELSFIQVRYSLLSQFRKAIAYLFVSKKYMKRCPNKNSCLNFVFCLSRKAFNKVNNFTSND